MVGSQHPKGHPETKWVWFCHHLITDHPGSSFHAGINCPLAHIQGTWVFQWNGFDLMGICLIEDFSFSFSRQELKVRGREREWERERKKLASREREKHFSPGTHYSKHTKPFLFQGQTRNNELQGRLWEPLTCPVKQGWPSYKPGAQELSANWWKMKFHYQLPEWEAWSAPLTPEMWYFHSWFEKQSHPWEAVEKVLYKWILPDSQTPDSSCQTDRPSYVSSAPTPMGVTGPWQGNPALKRSLRPTWLTEGSFPVSWAPSTAVPSWK